MSARHHLALVAAGSFMLTGCSIFSPIPLWELSKAAGNGAATAIQNSPGKAVDTVYHLHAPFKSVCIEFNPDAQTADVIPALQRALTGLAIESRVYEAAGGFGSCPVWLRYSTLMEWDKAPMSDRYQSYVSEAALMLQSEQGKVLSSSRYQVDPGFGSSKWASTFDKLSPVVTALVTGFSGKKQSALLQKPGAL
jgi:hypothetical protein